MTSANLVFPPTNGDTLVVDSWPVMEWFKRRKPATFIFRNLIEEAEAGRLRLIMGTIDLGEIYYNCLDVFGQTGADERLREVRDLPIEIFHRNEADALRAAQIKGLYKGAYGDAFAAVPAVDFIAPVLTGDKDFLKLQNAGLLVVEWIGK
jgi:predicted nucleic acid-binding protein